MKSVNAITVFSIGIFLFVTSCNTSSKPKEDRTAQPQTHSVHSSDETVYQCPMDPHIIKDAAGSCPVCGMELERKTYHEALMFLVNYKKENPEYKDGDELLKNMPEHKP